MTDFDGSETKGHVIGLPDLSIAIVCDWLTNLAGAERVVLAFHEIFPDAPIYTSVFIPEEFPQLAQARVETSFIQKIPVLKKKHQAFPLLRTIVFERFDLSGYDVVLSSSHAESKGVITGTNTLHICFCHTPIRYYWSGYHYYLKYPQFGLLNAFIKMVMPYLSSYLRMWDRLAADRVDIFIANSCNVAERIKKYYRRDATVINPPVDTSWIRLSDSPGEYFLTVGRLIPYKRVDLAIHAFNHLGLPLKIVGTGSEFGRLKEMAKSNIEFLGKVSDKELAEIYAGCIALVFPPEEDFGITPLEAMAAGRPVIAYRAGGAVETVIEGKTGVFFERQEPDSLIEAVKNFKPEKFDRSTLVAHAKKYDVSVFKEKIRNFVYSEWGKFSESRARLQ